MARWKVNGVDRETGDERQIWLEAASSEDAIYLAGNHNLVVAHVVEDMLVNQISTSMLKLELSRQQIKSLRVTPWDIGVGVFLGILLWTSFVFLCIILFWSLLIAGIVGLS